MSKNLATAMMTPASRAAKGKLVIFSGPAGAGKSTVVRRLMEQCPLPLALSVSATTRSPRPGEQNGVDYHFLSPEEFHRRRAGGEFLEAKEVFGLGNWYGTLRDTVTTGLNAGKWVMLEIDVQGTLTVLEQIPDAITIFIHPGTLVELERRLRDRKTETEAAIQRRLQVAREELSYMDRDRFAVVNDTVDRAVQEICEILSKSGETAKCSTN
jgi:guanylate kinase